MLGCFDQSFILQADASGKVLWSKTDDKVSKKNIIDGLIQDKDGRFVVSGKMVIRGYYRDPIYIKDEKTAVSKWLMLYDRAKAHLMYRVVSLKLVTMVMDSSRPMWMMSRQVS